MIDAIRDTRYFVSGNLKGYWAKVECTTCKQSNVFLVRSYETCIAEYCPHCNRWLVNTARYSPTTSHHQKTVALALQDVEQTSIAIPLSGGTFQRGMPYLSYLV